MDLGIRKGLAIAVKPTSGESVSIGYSGNNNIEFDGSFGTIFNSSANLSFNIDSDNSDNNIRYIDFRANGKGGNQGKLLMRIDESERVLVNNAFHVEGYSSANFVPSLSFLALYLFIGPPPFRFVGQKIVPIHTCSFGQRGEGSKKQRTIEKIHLSSGKTRCI